MPALGQAAVIPAERIAQVGEVPLGAALPVASTRPPFALADGTVAFTGLLDDGDAYVFIGDQVIWLGSDAMMVALAGTEPSLGAAVGGAFIYGPTVDGLDAVWTHNGLLALENDQAPAHPLGVVTTFHSRPSMAATGAAYWISGINASGGGVTENRVLFRSPMAAPGDVELLLSTGDMVDGLLIDAANGMDFDYQISDDETHSIHVLLMDTGSTINDGHIYVDGALLHQENSANGSGDNWDNFDLVAINDQGDYVFSGDTNGTTNSDEFVAVNGVIAVREGDVVAGVSLASTAVVRSIAINNHGHVAHAWGYDGAGSETLFLACDPADVAGSSFAVFTTGVDEVDFDGDGVADGVITDLAASNGVPTNGLSDDGHVYVELDIDDGGGELETMVQIAVTCCGNTVVDGGEECDDGNGDDTDRCTSNCLFAVCGDGFVQAGVEECDDGNADSDDACLNGCTTAVCGDGVVWAGVEACDDGNADDTDDCANDCTLGGGSTDGTSGSSDGGSSGSTGDSRGSTGGSSSDGASETGTPPGTTTNESGGVDETGGDSAGTSGGGSMGGGSSGGVGGPGGTAEGTGTDDTSGGGSEGDDGCSCRTDDGRASRGMMGMLFGLLTLGFSQRRRREHSP